MTQPQTKDNSPPAVAVTRCENYNPTIISDAIQRHFSLLGGIEKFVSRGDSVLLKPNLIAPKPWQATVQTDPVIILAVAKALKDIGAKPFVADSPAWSNVFACVRALGLDEPLKKLDVPVKAMDRPKRHKISKWNIGISDVALQADKIINMPKLKTHQQLTATFAVKNMFGCVCGKEKAFRHFTAGNSFRRFCRMLLEIYELLAPVVNIIDGVLAMGGPAPNHGKPRTLGFIVSGTHPIACEMLCCELISARPEDMPIIRIARQIGFGCADMEKLEILGDDYKQHVCTDFEPAEIIPLRFSLPQVCKSLAKQLLLLMRDKN